MRQRMRAVAVVLIVVGSLATSCGDDDGGGFVIGSTTSASTPGTTALATTTTVPRPTPTPTTGPPPATKVTTAPPPAAGTTLLPPTTTTTDPPPTPPTPPGTLLPTETAYYDEFNLQSGFPGDPWTSETVNAGSTDPVDVGYLGGSCVGWTNDIPDFQVTYESSGYTAPVLRFYFIPDDPAADPAVDTVLIVNATDGSWHCVDDSYVRSTRRWTFPTPRMAFTTSG